MATCQKMFHIIWLLAIINLNNGLQCPDTSQWKLRAKGICDRLTPWYYCLFDENTSEYKEFCRNKEDVHQPGYKYVVSGNINGKPCDLGRFQPFKFKTDGNIRCVFQKSVCIEEGLVDFKNGTTVSDIICRCDYTRGYAFVTSPKNRCECVPSQEDCSCYRKSCKEKEILTPDYECVETDHLIGGFTCPFIRNKRPQENYSKTVRPIRKDFILETIHRTEKDNTALHLAILMTIVTAFCLMFCVETTEYCIRFFNMNQIIADQVEYSIKEFQKENMQSGSTEDIISEKTKDTFLNMSQIIEERVEHGIDKFKNEFLQIEINEDIVPAKVKDLHDQHIKDWRRDDEKFIETEAAKQVETQLGKSNCVLVVGASGIGKSSIVRHLALKLCDENQYHIIPTVIDQNDIHHFYNRKRKQLFVIDDLCGKESINVQTVNAWSNQIDNILRLPPSNTNSIFKDEHNSASNVKFMFAVDIDLYNGATFNSLQSHVCDISHWPLNHQDKIEMIKNYISPESQTKLALTLDNLLKSDEVYFPLLCRIAEGKTAEQIIMLFRNLHDFIKHEFLALKDTNNLHFCIITLCALLNNRFKEEILSDKYDSSGETEAFANICKEFNLGKHQDSAKYKIKEHLENLEGTYLIKTANYYRFIHSKVYHIAVFVCGQACVKSFTNFVRSSCIAERFCFTSVMTENTGEFILIDKSEEKKYFDRLILDLEQGITYSTFHNSQLKHRLYREKCISYFQDRRPKVIEILNNYKRNSDTQSTPLNNKEYEDYINFKQIHFSSHKMRKPLIESAWEGFADIVEMLLASDCDINEVDRFRRTALYVACLLGKTEVVNVLLKNNADHSLCDENGQSPLLVASKEGYDCIVKALLQNHADINQCDVKGNSPLLVASLGSNLSTVQTLSNNTTDFSIVNNLGQTPVFVASMKGRENVVKYLLSVHSEYISKHDNEVRSPLFIACKEGYPEVVKILLSNKADVSQLDWNKRSPLFIASAEGYEDIVILLTQNNAKINQCDEECRTPLFIASDKGRTATVKILVNSGADLNATDNRKCTPLYAACRRGFKDIVKLLIEHRASITQCNKWNSSPLFAACRQGYLDIVKYLVENGSNISYPDRSGTTPLLIASENGHTEIVKFLIQSGAEIDQSDQC